MLLVADGKTLSDGLERLGWVIVMRMLTGLGKKQFGYV